MSGITNGFRQLTVGPALVAHAVAMDCTWPNGRASSLAKKVRMPFRRTHTRTFWLSGITLSVTSCDTLT